MTRILYFSYFLKNITLFEHLFFKIIYLVTTMDKSGKNIKLLKKKKKTRVQLHYKLGEGKYGHRL